MGLMDTIRTRVLRWLMPGEAFNMELRERLERYELHKAYYRGDHRRQIKIKRGQADDNLTSNYTQLIVDRSISMMLGEGIDFDLPGDADTENQLYIDAVWDANQRHILLHNAAQYAAVYGTGYFKIMPDALAQEEAVYPRIVALDPRWLTIHTHPEDVQTVTAYETRYQIVRNERTVNRREVISLEMADDMETFADFWTIRNYESSISGDWVLLDEEVWPYDFAPVVHWQNLPMAGEVYGEADIDGVVEIQDRINFISSNISRIIKYHAHPKTIGTGLSGSLETDASVDSFWRVQSTDARIFNLEMQSDLMSSLNYLMQLRQSLFDTARTVDITSMADKVGALTNFGLRVLYSDAIAKTETKRRLMEGALKELNRRILVIAGRADVDPGDIVWPAAIPVNPLEELQAAQIELDAGLVSRQTKAQELGRNWEEEVERLQQQAAEGDNVGAAILRAFNQGG